MTENNCQFRVDDCRCALTLYANKLIRCVSDIDAALLQRSSREQMADIDDGIRGEPNDGPKEECDDDGRPSYGGNVRLKNLVENIEKKMNDAQQIFNVVAELLRCCTKENPSSATINRLRTLSTTIMMDLKEVINASRTATWDKEKTAETAQTNNGVKRKRADLNELEDVGQDTTKRQKADENKSEMGDKINSITRCSATLSVANESRHCLEIEESRELQTNDNGPKNQNEYNERFLNFTSIIVKELLPYYEKQYFSNKDIFKFMVKTIIYRLMDSTICPGDHTVKSTIWQMMMIMPETRIKSKHDILKMLKPFY